MPVTTSATNQAAFEVPKDRFAWYAETALNKYEPAIVNANGYLEAATSSNLTDETQFVGICQYPAENAGDMATVVKGVFPAVANAAIAAGKLVEVTASTTTVNGVTYHTVAAATDNDLADPTVIGTALTAAAAAGDLVTVLIK